METMQPALKNGRNVWDRVNMPQSEFEGRVERIRTEMKRGGMDLLLLCGKDYKEYGDPCYVSNFVTRLPRGALAAVPLTGPVAVFFEGASRGLPSYLATTWVRELKAASDVARECVKYLKEKGLIPCTIGFGGLKEFMPHQQFQFLEESLTGCKIVDAARIVSNLRMVKSTKECDQIRRAGRIVKKAFDFIGSGRFDGMSEQLLDAMVRREARLEGAGDFRMLVGMETEKGWSFRPVEGRKIETGATVTVYIAVEFERYWAEAARTFVAGESSFSEMSGETAAIYAQAVAAVTPKRSISEVFAEVRNRVQDSGFEFVADFGLGGGIGLSLHESPVITEKGKEKLKERMCLALRIAAKEQSGRFLMMGNTLILGKEGVEIVTSEC
jgi:Xaa-Pro aminopeptidase